MKKFEFKMGPLLSYREYMERVAQQKTAKAHMDVKDSAGEISRLTDVKKGHAVEMEQVVEKGVSAALFRQHCRYRDAVEISIRQERMRKVELEKVLRKRLAELKKKSVDKKVMEVYRERLKEQYTQELIKNEQKELDEISSLKTARAISNEKI